ncbi:MAG: SDR family oxidoreductase [Candidatus Hydrogenedentes bacterium]|nr:SDR family oxidoreductase [Candidatus Hydrogenedentota bacterium]
MGSLLENQVAIITGAARGIGAATARLFAREGAKVVVSDRDELPARDVASEIRSEGGDAIAVSGDITIPAFPAHLIEESIAKYGRLNILVNNAGYTWDGMLHKMTDRQWQAMLEVHATAPFRLIRAAAPYMRDAAKDEQAFGRKREPRCVINISSTSGLHGNIGQANYSTAKLGIVGLTKTVAKEWGAFGVRCNAVAFGYIDTRLTQSKEANESIDVEGEQVALGIPSQLRDMIQLMIPLGRAGTVEEAAGALLLLASPYAAYINGHVLEVTGGMGI